MLKFLFDNFKDTPVVGTPIKTAYVGSLVKNALDEGVKGDSAQELRGMSEDDLEARLNEKATEIFDEYVAEKIKDTGVPDEVIEPAKEKCIEQLVIKLREKVDTKVDTKLGIERKEETEND